MPDVSLTNRALADILNGQDPYDVDVGLSYIPLNVSFDWLKIQVMTTRASITPQSYKIGNIYYDTPSGQTANLLFVASATSVIPEGMWGADGMAYTTYWSTEYDENTYVYGSVAEWSSSLQRYEEITSHNNNHTYRPIRYGRYTHNNQSVYILMFADIYMGGVTSLNWTYGSNNPYLANADLIKKSSIEYSGGSSVGSQIMSELYEEAWNLIFTGGVMELDVDVYSTAQGMFNIYWKNIRNLPVGMYSSSYLVGIAYSEATLGFYKSAAYKAGDISSNPSIPPAGIEFSYQKIFERLPDSAQQAADSDGYYTLHITCFHHDGNNNVFDLRFAVRFYPNGQMVDVTTNPQGILTLHPLERYGNDDSYDPNDTENATQVPGQGMSVDNLLTTSYVMNDNVLKRFGRWLWANNLQTLGLEELQTAPIENIISCKRIPFTVTGSDAQIVLGNVHTGIGWDSGTADYDGTVKIAETGHKEDIGQVNIPAKNDNSYLNLSNKISIYLPYCGIHTLPTSVCYEQGGSTNQPNIIGKTLSVTYYYDIIYGTCCALVYVTGSDSKKILIGAYNGVCGIDIPVTASNRAANQLEISKQGVNSVTGGISKIVGGVASGAATGLAGGAAGAVIGALAGGLASGVSTFASGMLNKSVSEAYQDIHYTTAGGFSSQIASFMSPTATLFVEFPKYTEPSVFKHVNGYPCHLKRKLSELSGYTEIDGEADLSGIGCFEEEQVALKQALMDGFYL